MVKYDGLNGPTYSLGNSSPKFNLPQPKVLRVSKLNILYTILLMDTQFYYVMSIVIDYDTALVLSLFQF